MRIEFTQPSPPDVKTSGGLVLYERSGELVGRVRRTPTNARTVTRRTEVSGVTGGARAFAYALTPTQQTEWDLCAAPDQTGIEILIQIWSELISAEQVPIPTGTSCPPSDAPTTSEWAVDPVGQSMTFQGDITDAVGDSGIVLRVSRPLPVGRQPRPEDTRFVRTIAPNTSVDIAAEYLARFGSFPPAGSRVMALSRATHPSEMRSSILVSSVTDSAAGFNDTCSVSSASPFTTPFGGITVDVEAEFEGEAPLAPLTLSVLTAGWTLVAGANQFNQLPASAFVQDATGVPRSEFVEFRWTLNSDPARTCEDGLTLEVIGGPPPPP